MRKNLCIVLALLVLTFCNAQAQKRFVLPPSEFSQHVTVPGIQILDVRTAEEYNAGHIIHSLQADWLQRNEFVKRVQHIDPAKPLYIYCESGGRSSDAGRWLRKNGFTSVYELQQGLIAWRNNNFPLESDEIKGQMTKSSYDSLVNVAPLVLIDFGAKWCPPCKRMEPVLEKLQREMTGQFVLTKIDGGVHTNIMREMKIGELPTFIVYKNGKEKWRQTGLVSSATLKEQLR